VRFSKDGQIAGAAFMPTTKNSSQEGKVFIYRMYDPQNPQNLKPEKQAQIPIKNTTLQVKECATMGKIIDLFIFKQQLLNSDKPQYNMYLILEKGILYYADIESGSQKNIKIEEFKQEQPALKANCCDFNHQTNQLVVDAFIKTDANRDEHSIRQYNIPNSRANPPRYPLENEKKFIRFFRSLVLSVNFSPRKQNSQEQQEEPPSSLQIYDFAN